MWLMVWPLRKQATRGRLMAIMGTLQRTAVAASRKFSSVPELRRADVFLDPPAPLQGNAQAGSALGGIFQGNGAHLCSSPH